jgi:uncharacterized protein (DUF58 family)
LATSFPFGFIKRAMVRQRKEAVIVYPALGAVDPRVLQLGRAAEKTGAMMRPGRGGLDEFYGVKEFRRGDNPRWIYWRRSARTGVLVCKEMTQVSPPRILVLVDTYLAESEGYNEGAVERAIAMAGSLADHALEAGMAVGLCVFSESLVTMAPNRGKRHGREILTVLARLGRNVRHTAQDLVNGSRELMKSPTTPVLFTPSDMQLGLGDQIHSGMVVIGSRSAQARRYFHFASEIDFEGCRPVQQESGKQVRAR